MDHKMTSMKLTEKAAKKNEMSEIFSPQYPWGLIITLNKDALKKLGITAREFLIGQKVAINAVTMVKEIGLSLGTKGPEDQRLELQITDMEVFSKKKSLDWDTDTEEADKYLSKKGI